MKAKIAFDLQAAGGGWSASSRGRDVRKVSMPVIAEVGTGRACYQRLEHC